MGSWLGWDDRDLLRQIKCMYCSLVRITCQGSKQAKLFTCTHTMARIQSCPLTCECCVRCPLLGCPLDYAGSSWLQQQQLRDS